MGFTEKYSFVFMVMLILLGKILNLDCFATVIFSLMNRFIRRFM